MNNLFLGMPTALTPETIAFNKEILRVKRTKLQQKLVFSLGKTKGVLKKFLGDKEMIIRGSVIKKSMKKDSNHILTLTDFINLPDYLNNPVAIFKSDTKEGVLIILTEIINRKNKPVIVAISSNEIYEAERVRSLYSKSRLKTYKTWIEKELLLYIKKDNFTRGVFQGLNLPNHAVKSSGDKDTKKSLNTNKMKNLFSLGLPLTDDIKKKAFTQNGKLRKGWYYDEYGLLTNGEEFYISYDRTWEDFSKKDKNKKERLRNTFDKKSTAIESFSVHRFDLERKQKDEKIIPLLVKKFKITKDQAIHFLNSGRYSYDAGWICIHSINMDKFKQVFGEKTNKTFFSKYERVTRTMLRKKYHTYWYYYNEFSKEILRFVYEHFNTKLSAPQTELTTEYFKKMKVSELRAFTLEYYNKHLKGKTATIKKHLKEVVFVSSAGRKLLQPIYKEKVAVIEHLEELIKNSTYNNWGNRKKTDSPEVLGYLNFKSKLTIDGEKRHIRISVILDRERKTKFKTFEVGTKPKKRHSNPQGSRS